LGQHGAKMSDNVGRAASVSTVVENRIAEQHNVLTGARRRGARHRQACRRAVAGLIASRDTTAGSC
jgi:hypothetical protein